MFKYFTNMYYSAQIRKYIRLAVSSISEDRFSYTSPNTSVDDGGYAQIHNIEPFKVTHARNGLAIDINHEDSVLRIYSFGVNRSYWPEITFENYVNGEWDKCLLGIMKNIYFEIEKHSKEKHKKDKENEKAFLGRFNKLFEGRCE